MRVGATSSYRRGKKHAPAAVKEWAEEWEKAAEAPDATPESVKADAVPLSANLREWMVRKYRRSQQGEWRLVFGVNEDEVYCLSLDPRGDDYKTPARLARQMKGLRVV